MECHYKVLGVELNADDSTIKKAYRKAALKYHPDKNLHCLEEATERFRLVQAAYDVLSDPQERAWYDRHREEILHRKKYENYKENSVDLWDFFSPSAYKGFGDDENGFYAVYNDVFKKIDAEDQPFKSDDADEEWMPSFGDSESDYQEVVHTFYSAWQAYCTPLSFVWESQYDVKEAPNRRIARMIEKENKKERDKHKKKRNELVRELVSFVRKRDPRVKAHKLKLEEVALEQAVKAEEHRASVMRAKAEEAALYDEAKKEELINHHKRLSELENMMKDEFGFSSSEDDGDKKSEEDSEEEKEYSDELFCVACNKLFKSQMGLRNHQKSKKHKENMNRLKEEMKHESAEQGEDPAPAEKLTNGDDSQEDEFISKSSKLSKKQKKQKRQQQKLLDNMMASKPMKVEDFEKNEEVSPDISIPNGKVESEVSVEEAISSDESKPECAQSEDREHNNEDCANEKLKKSDNAPRNKKGHTKKKAQHQPQTMSPDTNPESLGCGKCNQVFSSRNKLFQHLKKTGHSLPIDNGQTVGKRKSTKNRR